MRQHRMFSSHAGLLGLALLVVPLAGCGPTIFADTDALTVVGEPPPPPPPPEPEPEPEPPPKPKRVEVTADSIVIKEKIQFEYDKAIIRPESFDLVNEIVAVIQENPRIKKISIEGHTDSDGSAKYNKKLSQKRAEAVQTYLVEHGVEAARLQSVGHGEDKPLADNATDEGKETNRRVEFIILEQDEVTEVVEIDPATGEKKVVETKVEAAPKTEPEQPAGEPGGVEGGVVGGVAAPAEKADKPARKGPPAKASTKVEAKTEAKKEDAQ